MDTNYADHITRKERSFSIHIMSISSAYHRNIMANPG